MNNHVLTISEVADLTTLSKGTIYNYIKSGVLPPPLRLGPRRVGYRLADIEAWLASRGQLAWIEARDNGDDESGMGMESPKPITASITAREFLARALLVMRQTGDPDVIARACGIDPQAPVPRGQPGQGARLWPG